MITMFFQHLTAIFVESAPWLLFGFFVAGLIKAFVPTEFLHKHLGGNTASSVFKGAFLGAPLPLCSCGVIPAALGIRRAGASKSATTAFLIATPETGVDSVSITYALLGPLMAIVRPIAAITTAISAGLVVLWFGDNKKNSPSSTKPSSCCSSKNKTEEVNKPATKSSCCSSKKKSITHKSTLLSTIWQRVRMGLSFTFIDLIKDTVVWIIIGLCMAAFIMTVIPADFLATWGASPYAYLIMAIIGIPMYICAVASTPIAASLLISGVSPGAVLVFLLVGPATNVATIAIVRSEMGGRILSIYLSVIMMMSFSFGWITDALANQFDVSVIKHIHNHEHTTTFGIICSAILAIVLLNGLRRVLMD